MHGHEESLRAETRLPLQQGAAVSHHSYGRPEKSSGSRGAEADHDVGRDGSKLSREPGLAGSDMDGVGCLVDAPGAADRETEMLHRVGHPNLVAVDASFVDRLHEQPSSWADEGRASLVLDVSRLLADQREASVGRAPTEHRLGRVPEELAALTARGGLPQSVEIIGVRDEWGCAGCLVTVVPMSWISNVVR
jgi:hypothetical protein